MNEELKVVISAEISDLKQGVSEAQSEIDKLTTGNSGKFEEFSSSFGKIGDACTKGLAVVGTAVAGVATALLALPAATEEYRIAQEKLNSAFEAAGGNADVAKTVYNDLYRVLGDSDVAVEAANHLAKMTTSEQELAEWTEICQGVYATFGDSLPIEGLTEAVNHTTKLGEVQGPLADALEWCGINTETFNEQLAACATEGERAQLIQETLNGLYGEAAAAYEENAAGLLAANEAQAALDESMAALGETMEPINTALKELAADVLAQLAPYLQDFAEKHLPDIKDALSDMGTKIGEAISWIVDNWDTISTVATILGGIAAAIALVNAGLTAYNAVMAISAALTAPVTGTVALIVAGIAALVAIIVLCVKHWDEISAKVKEVVDNIKQWVEDMVAKVKEKWENLKTAISDKCEEIKTNVSEKWENLKTAVSDKAEEIKEAASEKWDELKEDAKEKFEEAKENMTNAMSEAKKDIDQTLSNMKTAYEEHGGGIQGIAAAAMEGVKGHYNTAFNFIDNLTGGKLSDIKEKFDTKMGEVKDKVEGALEKVKGFFSDKLGNAFNTVKDKMTNIYNWIKDKIEGARDKVRDAIDKIKGFFNFEFKWPKIPMPHFSISPSGWKIGDLLKGSIPKLSISWYAKGGVFDSPTLFGYGNGALGGLGEQGAEAIVPLEKNTEWLDRIAERLGAGSNRPVVLQVDGKTFAETSISTINELTRQTGSLSLVLV